MITQNAQTNRYLNYICLKYIATRIKLFYVAISSRRPMKIEIAMNKKPKYKIIP